MEKTKVFIPVDENEDYDIKSDIAFRQVKDGKIYNGRAKEQEGYFHTGEQMKKIVSDAFNAGVEWADENTLGNPNEEDYVESLNIK